MSSWFPACRPWEGFSNLPSCPLATANKLRVFVASLVSAPGAASLDPSPTVSVLHRQESEMPVKVVRRTG